MPCLCALRRDTLSEDCNSSKALIEAQQWREVLVFRFAQRFPSGSGQSRAVRVTLNLAI